MAIDATLLNTHKRDVFDSLRGVGLDPLQFEWTVRSIGAIPGRAARQVSELYAKSRPEFKFVCDFYNHFYHAHCSPWQGMRQSSLPDLSWENLLPFIERWAQIVNDELNTPDPWKALPGVATSAEVAVATTVANTEFSHREAEQLAKGLNEIKELFLGAVKDTSEHNALIEERMQVLLESTKRMGRKDWATLAIGTIVTLGVQLALPPDVVKQAFEILKQSLSGIVQLISPIIATGQHLIG